MELYCMDNEAKLVQAYEDPVILGDPRVIEKLLALEPNYVVTNDYFTEVQTELTAAMRKTCLSWLLEVSDHENLEPSVFPLAVNYLDRFLAAVDIKKSDFQLLGGVCLMLASKLRMSGHITTSILSAYTDNLYGPVEIVEFERTLLNQLRWNLSAVIPTDYLDNILYNLPNFEGFRTMVHSHSKVFIQLTLLEAEFITWPPSSLAVGSLGAAIKGLPNIGTLWPEFENLIGLIQDLTHIEVDVILHSIRGFERFVERHVAELYAQSRNRRNEAVTPTNKVYGVEEEEDEEYDTVDDNPETPTDVKDVQI